MQVPVATADLSSLVSPIMIMVTANDGSNTDMANVTINIMQDYDADDDGLIDINNLEQLKAIRWDLDDNGELDQATDADDHEAAFPDAATFDPTPTGYELMRNLDFDEDDS